jgi:hypothetical protein
MRDLQVKKLLFAFLLLVPISALADAITVNFTDSSSGIGNSLQYAITINATGATTGTATITVTVPTTFSTPADPYWLDAIGFKFWTGDKATLSAVTTPTSNWSKVDFTTGDVAFNTAFNPNSFPSNGFDAFYTNGLTAATPNDQQGITLLAGSSGTWMFNYSLASGSMLNATGGNQGMSFKALYYDGAKSNGTYFGNQMSQENGTVPEPASIFLLGSGLAGLAAMFRRKRP